MKLIISFFIVGLSFIILDSCAMDACINKTYFMSTYTNFMKDFEKNNDNYNASDWESKDKKVQNFVNNCYKELSSDMTSDEKVQFWTKYVKYMLVRHTKSAFKAIEIEDESSDVDIFDEISISIEEADLEKLLKEMYGDDLENAVDDVLKEINKWGDQLKNWLNTKNK